MDLYQRAYTVPVCRIVDLFSVFSFFIFYFSLYYRFHCSGVWQQHESHGPLRSVVTVHVQRTGCVQESRCVEWWGEGPSRSVQDDDAAGELTLPGRGEWIHVIKRVL